jgi:NitT/TauT family transport system substrate-binding protein
MNTKLTMAAGLLLGVALAHPARAADPVTIQLKWVTQAQFAGYYVSKAKNTTKTLTSTSPSNRAGRTLHRPR